MAVTNKDMQSSVDFMNQGLELVEGEYHDTLKKIVDNTEVAQSAADNDEKKAYLYALYLNNAISLGGELFLEDKLSDEMLKAFRALPKRETAQEVLKPFAEASDKERNAITERQQAFLQHNRDLEVFKAIALGESAEKAEEQVNERAQRMAQAMQR